MAIQSCFAVAEILPFVIVPYLMKGFSFEGCPVSSDFFSHGKQAPHRVISLPSLSLRFLQHSSLFLVY
ncbi:hypothetical protein JCM18901_1183 [Psychrobacter sp. JCM 18901]|nr:hypothetical protein JCM18901_1183 [Psychrobacter sp. JCM 18901]